MFKIMPLFLSLGLAITPALRADDGETLITKSDCLTCHKVDRKMVGPAYKDVAKKYKGKPGAVATLVKKVKAGGSGNWGTVAMTPHPNLSDADLEAMVKWVLSSDKIKPKPTPAPAAAAPAEKHQEEAAPAGEGAPKKKKKHKPHAAAHGHGHAEAIDYDTESGVKAALKKQDCFGCHSYVNAAGGIDEFVWPDFAKIQKRGGDRAMLVKKVRTGEGSLRWGQVPHPHFEHLSAGEVDKLVGAILDGTWAKGEAKAKTLEEMTGMEWMQSSSDCLSCHAVDVKKTGPAFKDVAKRYAGAGNEQVKVLVKKVKEGGQGNWNLGAAMTPHKDAPDAALEKAVRWVLEQK